MTGTVLFDPLLPWPVLGLLAAVVLGGVILAVMRGLSGWALRGMAGLVILGALAGPSLQEEDRAPLSDIVILAEDQSASQRLRDRPDQTESTADAIAASLDAREGTEVRRITVPDGDDDTGTRLMGALSDALAEEPRARIAGLIAISDGVIHDPDLPFELPAPLHVLLTGKDTDWDRRLLVKNAPAFAIIGEPVTLTLRIEDSGAAPGDAGTAPLDISVDGAEPQRFNVRIGEDIDLPITLPHGGRNVIQFTVQIGRAHV